MTSNPPPKFEIDPRYRWREFVKRAGGNPRTADDVYAVLQKLYGEDHRAYHTMGHISWCIDLLHEMSHEPRPDWFNRAELALWFHDVIYDPQRKDNELRSASLMLGMAALLDLDPMLAQKAVVDVEATTHLVYFAPPDESTRWVLDIDLASLGFAPARFDENTAQIRQEYAHVSEPLWNGGRKVMLQMFLDRPRIYLTDQFHERFEAQARENLKRAIQKLG